MQYALFDASLKTHHPLTRASNKPFKQQLLKWIGNKQRFAHEIVDYFPVNINRYYEPFLGSGAVLGTLAPSKGFGSDVFAPLIGIWQTLKRDPELLIKWYADRLALVSKLGKEKAYVEVLASYNAKPNPADFVFLSRACYGGVVRFRRDGYMSTPCGPHSPVSQHSFRERVMTWAQRVKNSDFAHMDYQEAMKRALPGDLVYCDPPYSHTQAILYGAQDFNLKTLFEAISLCRNRGVNVALSIDGSKKSGQVLCDIVIPTGLFDREVSVNVGRSMLRRFQKEGHTLEDEVVHDRLLLTY